MRLRFQSAHLVFLRGFRLRGLICQVKLSLLDKLPKILIGDAVKQLALGLCVQLSLLQGALLSPSLMST